MKQSTATSLKFMAVAIAMALLWTFFFIMSGSTLVTPLIPLAIGAAVGAAATPLLWNITLRKLTAGKSKMRIFCIWAIYAATVIPAAGGTMLAINRYTAGDSPHTVVAHVTSKHTRQENEYRQAGRRRIYSGQHTVYYLTVSLPDGRSKEHRVKVQTYVSTRIGKPVEMTIHRGALGFDVIDSTSLRLH